MFSKIKKFFDTLFKCNGVSNCCNSKSSTHYVVKCSSCSKIYKLKSYSETKNERSDEVRTMYHSDHFTNYFCPTCN